MARPQGVRSEGPTCLLPRPLLDRRIPPDLGDADLHGTFAGDTLDSTALTTFHSAADSAFLRTLDSGCPSARATRMATSRVFRPEGRTTPVRSQRNQLRHTCLDIRPGVHETRTSSRRGIMSPRSLHSDERPTRWNRERKRAATSRRRKQRSRTRTRLAPLAIFHCDREGPGSHVAPQFPCSAPQNVRDWRWTRDYRDSHVRRASAEGELGDRQTSHRCDRR